MLSNLPPGVSEYDIPGNRPEDEEVEITMIFTRGDIDELRRYNDIQMSLPISQRHELWAIVLNMTEQFDDAGI